MRDIQSKTRTPSLLRGLPALCSIMILAAFLALAPAPREALAQTGGGGGHDNGGEAASEAGSEANDAAMEAQDAVDQAREAMEALQQGANELGQAQAGQGGTAGTSVSLSTPGQAVTAMSGHAPSGGASPADRAKLDAVSVNPKAWSPF